MQYDARVSEYLLELLRSALNDTVPDEKPADISWGAVYALAKKHSVTALAFSAIQKLKDPPEQELFQIWQTQNSMLIVKGENQENERSILSECFEKNGISYMPLKGSVIRALFPQPYLREMSDLDILIKKNEMEKACSVVESLGYSYISPNEHHLEFQKRPYMTLELHDDLIPASFVYHGYYKNPWFKSKLKIGNYGYGMTNEDAYLYLLAHSAKHYYYCGTGIRSVIDVYVFNRHFHKALNRKYISDELKKLNLTEFAFQMESLSEHWFSNESSALTEEIAEMESYILSASTFGSKKMYLSNVVRAYMKKGHTKNNAKTRTFLHMAFLPCNEMQLMFPVLKKAPVFLPFCWIARWFRIIFTKPKSITDSYKRVQNIQIYDSNNDS